jgi:catalase (peroxidase I)
MLNLRLRSAGLEHARRFLEPIKEKHPWITYADLWTLAGVTAIKEMGGPDCAWKPGRTDFVDDSKVSERGNLARRRAGSSLCACWSRYSASQAALVEKAAIRHCEYSSPS